MKLLMRFLLTVVIVATGVASPPLTGRSSTSLQSAPVKQWSGIHLGVRPWADWNANLYGRIDPQQGGTWPDVVVLMSDQFYNVVRDPNTHRITGVTTGRPTTLSYLQRASQAGVHIIIRIQPSPGNFAQNSANNHRLLLTAIDYTHGDGDCRRWENGCHRSHDDIGDHIIKIHNYNSSNGINEWGFEPANEPNIEWYDQIAGNEFPDTIPNQSMAMAWQDMNAYFQAIYQYVKAYSTSIHVLTPAMAQGQYAEGIDTLHPPTCSQQLLVDTESTGYNEMRGAYESYRDAVSWHNYWRLGYEGGNWCAVGGQHVSYYFPSWLKNSLYPVGVTEGFITEADLLSLQQDGQQPIQDKDEQDGMRAALSIRRFMYYELRSYHIASWLLNDLTGNAEYGWHEAYRDSGVDVQVERPWFRQWWLGSELPPFFLPLMLKSS